MKKLIALILTLSLCALPALAEADPEQTARTILDAFLSGDYQAVWEMLDDNGRQAVTAEALESVWTRQLAALGEYQDAQFYVQENAAAALLTHENGQQQLTVALNEDGTVHVLSLVNVSNASAQAPERALPEGVIAQRVTLFPGTEKELSGEILTPAGGCAAYAVLIHGSGASDLNESAGAVQPFRDLAYDLAENGVGTLRFDKITYAHPELGAETVVQEYLEPVAEALRVLREPAGDAQIYAVGHSEGGMLMPWLVSECGFDGGVALAGTPKALWEISYEQNLASVASFPEDQQDALKAQLEPEYEKALRLPELADDETVFGMTAKYQRSIADLDEIGLAKSCGKPMLFLWGDADFQISQDAFDAWKVGLGEEEPFAYIVYPGLNHCFTPAQEGDSIANAAEVYARPAVMDPQVARDIAEWMGMD